MKQGLLLIETKGKPAERYVSNFADAMAKFKGVTAPDTHATLYRIVRVKHRHNAGVPEPIKQPKTKKAE